jgi:hypothetical protein
MKYEESYLLGIATCRPLKANRRFGGTYCLHLQGRRISIERNQHEAGSLRALFAELCLYQAAGSGQTLLATCFMLVYYLAYSLNPKMEVTCSERRLNFNGLHGVISQKIGLFITAVVIASNPTK